MNGKELLNGVELLHREKNISRDTIFGAIEKAVRLAIHKCYEDEEGVAVSIDRATGEIHAQKGEQTLSPDQLGRIAAQSAKQAIIQLLREEESQNVFNQYSAQKGDLVHGTVQRIEGGAATVTIGKVEALLPRGEQIPGESHHVGERVKAVILDVRKVGHRVKIILSRNHPDFVRRLFETEIPEIEDQTISIKAVAREAGHRTKVAVSSIDMKVDCVGACVGVRGSRIKNIIDELGGERIDIVRWNDSLQVLIPNALQPASIEDVMLYPRLGRAIVLVKEDQLSLAIGRRGQNVRLASKLVGWDIEIMTHEELNTSIERAEISFVEIPGVTPEMVEAFIEEGFLSYTDLTFVEAAELAELGGVTEDQAEEIIAYAEEKAEEQEEEARVAKPETPAHQAPQTAAAKAAKLFAPLGEDAATAPPSEAKQTFESLFGPAQEAPPISPVEETGPAPEATSEEPPAADTEVHSSEPAPDVVQHAAPETVPQPVDEQPTTSPAESAPNE
jgi:N utilization substance protein A